MATYIETFETEFRKRLASTDSDDALVKWVSERVLESHRNGITAGQNSKTVKRQGESRRRGSTGKAE